MLEDNNNILLKRREIKSIIRNATGSIPREEAANLIAGKIGVNKKNLLPISLKSEFGNPDVLALMYYYDDIEEANYLNNETSSTPGKSSSSSKLDYPCKQCGMIFSLTSALQTHLEVSEMIYILIFIVLVL